MLTKGGNTIAPPEWPRAATNVLPPKPIHPVRGCIRQSDIANDDSSTLIEADNCCITTDDASTNDENMSNTGDNHEDSQTEHSKSDCCDKNASNKGDNHEDGLTEDSKNDCCNENMSSKGDKHEDSQTEHSGCDNLMNVEGNEIGDDSDRDSNHGPSKPPHIAVELVDFSTPHHKRHRSCNRSCES